MYLGNTEIDNYQVHAEQHPSVIVRVFDLAWRDESPLELVLCKGGPYADELNTNARSLIECMARLHSATTTWSGNVAEFTLNYVEVPSLWDTATHVLVNHPDGTDFSTGKGDS